MSLLHLTKNANRIFNKFGYNLSKSSVYSKKNLSNTNKVMLNIGSGDWTCEGWTNLDYPSEWYAKVQKKHKIIPYDIRNDKLPFEDGCIDVIYCSHVIEHIEDKYIQELFKEIFRVLKKNGVARFCCPDAEFLYQVSKTNSDYWEWRNEWFSSEFYTKDEQPRVIDFFVREVATPKLLGYKNGINEKDYISEFNSMPMNDFLEYLTQDLSFRNTCVGDHINYWTFDKAAKMLTQSGFNIVIRSKHNSSVCREMQDPQHFDLVYPNMSLYVEVIKN